MFIWLLWKLSLFACGSSVEMSPCDDQRRFAARGGEREEESGRDQRGAQRRSMHVCVPGRVTLSIHAALPPPLITPEQRVRAGRHREGHRRPILVPVHDACSTPSM
jgi:hypothetical protein